jgi:hypothetical protein
MKRPDRYTWGKTQKPQVAFSRAAYLSVATRGKQVDPVATVNQKNQNFQISPDFLTLRLPVRLGGGYRRRLADVSELAEIGEYSANFAA